MIIQKCFKVKRRLFNQKRIMSAKFWNDKKLAVGGRDEMVWIGVDSSSVWLERTNKKLIDMALQLEGLYRHASTHAAGVVIGDRPLHELIPLYRDPRSDMPVTQYNMKYIEDAGLIKFDFLGLKTLTVLDKAVKLIRASVDPELDLGIATSRSATFSRGNRIGAWLPNFSTPERG